MNARRVKYMIALKYYALSALKLKANAANILLFFPV